MKVRGTGLGGQRNGLPERKNYVYKGSGNDEMPWAAPPERRYDPRRICDDCDQPLRSAIHRERCLLGLPPGRE